MSCFDTALAFTEAGYHVCLIKPNDKKPIGNEWQNRRYAVDELRRRFDANPALNVGIVLGEVIDVECDSPEAEQALLRWFDGVEPQTISWQSARGKHRLFLNDARFASLGAVVKVEGVEVRLGGSKGAQSLLPPSVTDEFTREWINGPETPIADLPESVKLRVLAAAAAPRKAVRPLNREKPGDDFCSRATWEESGLTEHGWKELGTRDGVMNWQRPGKDDGVSATTGHCQSESGRDLFYIFTTNAQPFEAGKSYNKFSVYALLHHDGDFRAASKALRAKGYGKQEKQTASSLLVELTQEAELFHDSDGTAYATVPFGSDSSTYKVNGNKFKQWLGYQFYQKTGKPPGAQALCEALGVVSAKALYEGAEHVVSVRVAAYDGAIYFDLGNDRWEVVKITADGWEVVQCPKEVKFIHPKGMLPVPTPVEGGSIDELRPFVNLDESSWILFVASLVAALNPRGPYAVALFIASHGSAKSTSMRVGRLLIDPNKAPIRAAPRDIETLILAATNGAIVAIDNASSIPEWLADALCRLATGGGLGKRELYSDGDETLFDVMRPAMITAITDPSDRGDLLSRCLILRSPALTVYKAESDFYAEFESKRPAILGSLLTAVSAAIRNLPTTCVTLPRMADFFRWVSAAETGLGWEVGTFARHYTESQKTVSAIALDNPVAAAIQQLGEWSGTATELLRKITPADVPREFPRTNATLGKLLKRLVPDLRKIGIHVEQDNHTRVWNIRKSA